MSLASFAQVMISGLKTEGQINPVGLDIVQPRFSWVLESSKRNVRQVAYELTVRQGKKQVWSSGKVSSENSIHVPYAGNPLESGRKYSWQVKVWDNQGSKMATSTEGYFHPALFK